LFKDQTKEPIGHANKPLHNGLAPALTRFRQPVRRAVKNIMKDLIKLTLLISLNIIFTIVVLWSTMIYTSMMSDKLPWYESCGMQFLAILIISCPALIIIGFFELLLSRFMPISQKLKLLPFACSLGMGLLIFIDQSLGFIMQF
jgi:hypothetical protein